MTSSPEMCNPLHRVLPLPQTSHTQLHMTHCGVSNILYCVIIIMAANEKSSNYEGAKLSSSFLVHVVTLLQSLPSSSGQYSPSEEWQ